MTQNRLIAGLTIEQNIHMAGFVWIRDELSVKMANMNWEINSYGWGWIIIQNWVQVTFCEEMKSMYELGS